MKSHIENSKKNQARFETTLVDKIKRKVRILLSKMPVFNTHFGQHFLPNSLKLLPRPTVNDHSYAL